MTLTGIKYDQDKLDYTLLPWSSVDQVVQVLEFGAEKYTKNNWQLVSKERYLKALFRHVIAYAQDETLDSESQLPHLAHAVCCALFILYEDANDTTILSER